MNGETMSSKSPEHRFKTNHFLNSRYCEEFLYGNKIQFPFNMASSTKSGDLAMLRCNTRLYALKRVVSFMTIVFIGTTLCANSSNSTKELASNSWFFVGEPADHADSLNEKMLQARRNLTERTGVDLGSYAITSTPPMVSGFLPFHFSPFDGISLHLLKSDPVASRGIETGDFRNLISAFNIQVLSDNVNLSWPTEAKLAMRLSKQATNLELEFNMKLERSSYVFSDPLDTLQKIMEAVSQLDRMYPDSVRRVELDSRSLQGFASVISKAEELSFPAGVPVTYSYRLGEIRLSSHFEWLGRQPEILEVMPQKVFFQ